MPTVTDVTGLAGIAVAFAALVLALPGVRRLPRPLLAGLLAVMVALFLAPLGTLPLAAVARGATGDLSITTLLLLGSAVLRRLTGWPPVDPRARFALLAFIAAAALALYPMALGVGRFDPYRLGYGAPWLFGALTATALVAWFGRFHLLALCIALATLAWAVGWYESDNLWDYLLDPLVSFYALGALSFRGAGQIRRACRSAQRGAAPVDSTRRS
ncbi:MAG: hypothetical protein EXS37_09960 [Opitutus sp.]|nr:hypothetical protein [Opitutus sp.]